MIDLHCHLLPGLDDGPADWEETLAMCRLAQSDGICHVVATPHANGHYLFERPRGEDLLVHLREQCPFLEFSLGCDFHLSFENVREALEDPFRYAIGTGRFVLTELSDYATPNQIHELVFRLHCAGFRTIISHPERNALVAQYPELARDLVAAGSVLQLTGSSLTGEWGRGVKKLAIKLMEEGLIGVLASDGHDSRKRKPVLSKAVEAASKLVGEVAAGQLVNENPATVIHDGQAVPT